MLIFDQTSYVKIYSLNITNNGTSMIENTGIMKNIAIMNDVIDFYPFSIFPDTIY